MGTRQLTRLICQCDVCVCRRSRRRSNGAETRSPLMAANRSKYMMVERCIGAIDSSRQEMIGAIQQKCKKKNNQLTGIVANRVPCRSREKKKAFARNLN